jgi:5'-deoxynucleotidase YfbR-like HD superfamily hydrolase
MALAIPVPHCTMPDPSKSRATERAWVRLYSGKRLDLLDPTPFDWEDSDLAIGLARTYRWGGHSAWPLPLSVAQHSLLVLTLHRQWSPKPAEPKAELRELLHDADEGLLGFDCISVLKPLLGESYRKLTERLEAAIVLRYGLLPWADAEWAQHKRADRVAAATEAVHVVGWTPAEVRTTLKIPYEALAEDPLATLYGGKPFEPWPPQLAAKLFLDELERLGAAINRARSHG